MSGKGELPRKKRVIDLTALVPANDTTDDTEDMPFNGFIDGIIAGWPDGADTFVGVRVANDANGRQYFPSGNDRFAAYNNFTKVFPVSFPVREGETIRASYKNNKNSDVPITVSLQAYGILPDEDMEEIERRLS